GRYRGAWEGNDTAWRTAADLYLCMLNKTRKFFSVIDGVLAGEKDGPFLTDTKYAGALLASTNLLAADYAAARLMGLKTEKIKYLAALMERLKMAAGDIEIIGEPAPLGFLPPEFWPGLAE
ncbi:MAG: hypothetical protein WCI43_07215, partial [Candidatus Firestonebacteria bacterium]